MTTTTSVLTDLDLKPMSDPAENGDAAVHRDNEA